MAVILACAAKEDAGFVKDKVATAARRVNFSFVMVSTRIARVTKGRVRRLRTCPAYLRPFPGGGIDPDQAPRNWAKAPPGATHCGHSCHPPSPGADALGPLIGCGVGFRCSGISFFVGLKASGSKNSARYPEALYRRRGSRRPHMRLRASPTRSGNTRPPRPW